MPAPVSTTELLEFVRKSGVVPSDKLDRFVAEVADLPTDPGRTANVMVQKKLLTAFQAKLLLAGRYKGFRLGAYLLQDQLGQGGMGAVYLAMHETLRRKAAIKVLPPGGNKLAVERFLREARAAAALDHPNIVRTHDVGRDGEVHFLVMEYVEGQTLDRLVASGGPLSTQRAVEYIAQAAAGLQHAYEKGFIHRDVKPSNLILGKDGTVKILDMGLARSFEQDDQLTAILDHDAVVGTADYISPEQAMNDPNVDIRTDIYSLGGTFFSILTGRPPFDGPTASKLLQHQMKEAPSLTKLDKTIPKELAWVVTKMMAKKANDRYQTPADVIVALRPWLMDTPSLMAGLSQTLSAGSGKLSSQNLMLWPSRAPAHKKPNWIWALAGGVAALLLLSAGVALAVMFNGNNPTNPTVPATVPTTRHDPKAKGETEPVKRGDSLGKLSFADAKPITIRKRTLDDQDDPNKKHNTLISSTGEGTFPPDWALWPWNPETLAEAVIDQSQGDWALGIRNAEGPATTMLFTPTFACPTGYCRLRCEVLYTGKKFGAQIRMMPEGQKAFDVLKIEPEAGWQTIDMVVDCRSPGRVKFEFHNSANPDEFLWIRKYEVFAASKDDLPK